MCGALIAVVASVSGLNVAQQDLALDLGASQNQLLWVINGYTMALAALLLPIGAIGDRWGRKPILVGGLVLFIGANLVAGLASTTGMLLVARILAGVAAAMIMPVTLSVITSSFPPDQRARAVGIWSGFAGAGGILGLFVSSFIVDYFTWPWLFGMPVLFAAGSLAMTLRAVDNSARSRRAGSTPSVRWCRRSPSARSCWVSTRARSAAGPIRWPPAAWLSACSVSSASSPGSSATSSPSSTSGSSRTAGWRRAR